MGISADTALRPERFFGMDARTWIHLQARYDILTARAAIGADVERIVPLERDAA